MSFNFATNPVNISTRYFTQKKYFFSDQKHADTFCLQMIVNSTDYENAKVYFYIKDYKGKRIFADTLKGLSLYTYSAQTNEENPGLTKEKLLNGFYDFFDKKHFHKLPIQKDIEYAEEEELVDRQTWEAIQNNPNQVAFTYTILEESIVSIVYIKAARRVVKF
ncbi:hypothetical protein QNI22_28885 [Cytophagaceae bacterium BD1B2-1]|uniref:Uncharacterized protein n=1 Tax=Xanthocytophaga agilis TaxID=3048010 RepID=A0AAE3RBU1_9BACT|nr:hypothetical protein [Xanthocytophaga agilis]